jgi:hypothetical protein
MNSKLNCKDSPDHEHHYIWEDCDDFADLYCMYCFEWINHEEEAKKYDSSKK